MDFLCDLVADYSSNLDIRVKVWFAFEKTLAENS